MGLFDFFRQRDRDSHGASTPAAAVASEPIEAARTRARRRLIGAVVLLGIGIIAFPILFETQPRPIPVDIPIQIPSRENAPPLALPAAKPVALASSAPAVAPVATDEAPRDPVPSTTAAPKTAPTAAAKTAPTAAPAPVVAVATPPKAEAAPPKAQPAPAPAPVAVAAPKAEASAGRFVVQVGAFAESTAVREARAKVEKLGLTTYTQVVETPAGARTRVRLGPFATREEADKAAGKVKAAGLPASVLTL